MISVIGATEEPGNTEGPGDTEEPGGTEDGRDTENPSNTEDVEDTEGTDVTEDNSTIGKEDGSDSQAGAPNQQKGGLNSVLSIVGLVLLLVAVIAGGHLLHQEEKIEYDFSRPHYSDNKSCNEVFYSKELTKYKHSVKLYVVANKMFL